MPASVFLFDLDGTLTDPQLGIVRSMRYALERLNGPALSDEDLAATIGPPLRPTFAALLGTADSALVEEAMRLYRERFADIGIFENRVYPGVPALLAAAQRHAACFVATSKPTVYAERIMAHFGLAQFVRSVYGAELDGHLQHKPELLAHLFAAERIAPADAVMIGDRAVDILAAKAHGARSVGVLWGYGSEAELRDAAPDALCATPEELADVLFCIKPSLG